jgi:hypothetical protein
MSTGARIRAMPIRRILRISGCTAAIEPGKWSGKDLAWAYDGRGAAYIGVRPWLAPRVDGASILMAPIRFPKAAYSRAALRAVSYWDAGLASSKCIVLARASGG